MKLKQIQIASSYIHLRNSGGSEGRYRTIITSLSLHKFDILKRKVKPRQFSDFVLTNLINSAATNNNRCFKITHAKSNTLKYAFTIPKNHASLSGTILQLDSNAESSEAVYNKSQLKNLFISRVQLNT